MSTKMNPGKFNCHAAAYPDEPVFTLLGRDPAAPATIKFWRQERVRLGKTENIDDLDRIAESILEAQAFEVWRAQNLDPFGDGTPTWRTPHTVPEGNPIRVEPAAMEVSVKDTLMQVLSRLSNEHRSEQDRIAEVFETLTRVIDAIEANVPCVPTAQVVTAVERDTLEHIRLGQTRGETVVIDTGADDLSHAPEVPPHRFSQFHKGEGWAYAKGLEINPTHLPTALDAMELDGWETVCVFGQTDSQHVGFLFKRVALPAVAPLPGNPYEHGTAPRLPKIEVHVEGMAHTDMLSLMAVIECRMRWLPQDYEQVQIVGLIDRDPEAAFDFTQARGRIEQRRSLAGSSGCNEYGRQLEP